MGSTSQSIDFALIVERSALTQNSKNLKEGKRNFEQLLMRQTDYNVYNQTYST